MKKIAILGSTGSIGTQTLEIVRTNKDIKVTALAAGRNIDLLEKQIEVEEYIRSIEGSRIRRIMRYRYLDNLTWQQVANRMGKGYTKDYCRIAHDRLLKKNL